MECTFILTCAEPVPSTVATILLTCAFLTHVHRLSLSNALILLCVKVFKSYRFWHCWSSAKILWLPRHFVLLSFRSSPRLDWSYGLLSRYLINAVLVLLISMPDTCYTPFSSRWFALLFRCFLLRHQRRHRVPLPSRIVVVTPNLIW